MPGIVPLARSFAILMATLAIGCNEVFDIHVGAPPPVETTWCVDPVMIDDMEDGDGKICQRPTSDGRSGSWFTMGDGTSTELQPAPADSFAPTLIPQGRGASRYAAHMTGSRFTDWGASMGFTLKGEGPLAQPYDASGTQGVRFWMKSNAPVSVAFSMPETLRANENGGTCADNRTALNCDNHFQFSIAAVKDNGTLTAAQAGQWVEYDVPFAAAAQPYFTVDLDGNPIRGSATWNPSHLVGVTFTVDPLRTFDVWIDDVRFIPSCAAAGCVPTCPDPSAPVACPARGGAPAICWPLGTDCANVLAPSLNGVWGSGPGDVWAVGGQGSPAVGAIAHWDGSAWSSVANGLPPQVLNKVWGNGPDDVWAVGNGGTIIHWDGADWSATASGTNHPLLGLWGSGANDVWAVGGAGTILHWNGSAWSAATDAAAYTLAGVWGSNPNDAWAVGYSSTVGVILHWDGSTWSVAAPGGATLPLADVWGSGANDVWSVGGGGSSLGGTILHWNGMIWTSITRVTTRKFLGVWGSGSNDIWAVGGAAIVNPAGSLVGKASGAVDSAALVNPVGTGTAVHGSGTAWSAALINAPLPLNGVWGSGPGDVWAVAGAGPSYGGAVLHWDGSAWSSIPVASGP